MDGRLLCRDPGGDNHMPWCRLKHLRWSEVDFVADVITSRRSKPGQASGVCRSTPAGKFGLDRLRIRLELAEAYSSTGFVFPGCETGHIDPSRAQRSWRTAWRNLTRVAGLSGFRFRDLRHVAVTEMAESGKGYAQTKAIAGHLSNGNAGTLLSHPTGSEARCRLSTGFWDRLGT
jgi:integrase